MTGRTLAFLEFEDRGEHTAVACIRCGVSEVLYGVRLQDLDTERMDANHREDCPMDLD